MAIATPSTRGFFNNDLWSLMNFILFFLMLISDNYFCASIPTIEYMRKWPKKGDTLIYKDEASKYPKGSYVPCVSGDLQCFFDVDGRIYACNGTWDDGFSYNEVGFKKAWNYLKDRKCVGCKCIGMTELHSLLDLYPESIINGVKNILRLQK